MGDKDTGQLGRPEIVAQAKLLWDVEDLAEVSLPEVGFWWGRLIPKSGVVLLHGKFGTYKTPLTFTMANSLATGEELWGFPAEKCRVLYIEADSPQIGIVPRMQQIIGDSRGFLTTAFAYPGFDIINPQSNRYDTETFVELRDAHAEKPWDVVFVDSLRVVHNLPEKENESPSRVYRAFAHLFPFATVVFVHHDRKSSPDWRSNQLASEDPDLERETFSGAQAWINLATTSAKVQRESTASTEYVRIVQTKSQVGEVMAPLNLKVGDDGATFSTLATIDKDLLANTLKILCKGKQTKDVFKSDRAMDEAIGKQLGYSRQWVQKQRKIIENAYGFRYR